MRDKKVFAAVLLLSAAAVLAVSNPNVQSPIGAPTAVPSAGRSGLVSNRPQNALSGEGAFATGSQTDSRYMRSRLPYSTPYYPRVSAVDPWDDFPQRIYDPVAYDRSPGQMRYHYDPRRNLFGSGILDNSGQYLPTFVSQTQHDRFMPPMLPQTFNTQYRQRPLSLSESEAERLMNRQMQLRQERQRQREESDAPKDAALIDLREEASFFREYLRPEEITRPKEETQDEPKEDKPKEDTPQPKPEEAALIQDDSPRQPSELMRLLEDAPADEEEPPTEEEIAIRQVEKAQGRALLQRYGSFDAAAKARAAEYMAAGEILLREEKYYKAADAFALAAIWTPQDVRPYVGQAIALFAAGEYMSSAYLLRQAMAQNPNVASEKINPAALIGDRDVFDQRLVEMATWHQRSGSGDLAFLIAYILHHDGKTRNAAEAIRAAAEKLPDDPAVRTLQHVIVPDSTN